MKYQLDLRGYLCPMPLLMANKALHQLQQGDNLLLLLKTDTPVKDIELLCQQKGYALIWQAINEKEWHCQITK